MSAATANGRVTVVDLRAFLAEHPYLSKIGDRHWGLDCLRHGPIAVELTAIGGDQAELHRHSGCDCDLAEMAEAARQAREAASVAATAEHVSEVFPGSSKPAKHFYTATELMVEAGPSAVEWLPFLGQPGLVAREAFTLISGRPKAGKTTLLAHAVKAWLDQGLTVAWLTEEPKAKWRERIDALDLHSERFLLAFPDLAKPAEWAERLRALAPDVAIVDTARTFCQIFDENDSGQVHRALMPLILMARDLRAALVVSHHRRKADGDEGTDHAGSHAFVGDADVAATLKEDSASPRRRELSTRSRFDETPAKLLLELTSGEGYRALGAPEAVSLTETTRRVGEVLTADWAKTSEVREALAEPRPSRELVRQALASLVKQGAAERQEGKGRRADLWRAAAGGESVVATTSHVLHMPTGSSNVVATTDSVDTAVVATTDGGHLATEDAGWFDAIVRGGE